MSVRREEQASRNRATPADASESRERRASFLSVWTGRDVCALQEWITWNKRPAGARAGRRREETAFSASQASGACTVKWAVQAYVPSPWSQPVFLFNTTKPCWSANEREAQVIPQGHRRRLKSNHLALSLESPACLINTALVCLDDARELNGAPCVAVERKPR